MEDFRIILYTFSSYSSYTYIFFVCFKESEDERHEVRVVSSPVKYTEWEESNIVSNFARLEGSECVNGGWGPRR